MTLLRFQDKKVATTIKKKMKLFDINRLIPIKDYSLATSLRSAIKRDQLCLYYFPVIDIATKQTVDVEALIRWPIKEDIYMPPMEFLPVAEANGLMPDLTRWIINTSLRDLSIWLSEGFDLGMTVNLSPVELNDTGLPVYIEQVLAEHNLSPARLGVELAEKHVAEFSREQHRTLEKIHQSGIRLILDNVAGDKEYDALLNRQHWHSIKLDWRLGMTMTGSRQVRSKINQLIQHAASLDTRMVVPGVHTYAEWDCIRKKRQLLAQGFYITPPQSHRHLETWFRLSQWQPPQLAGFGNNDHRIGERT